VGCRQNVGMQSLRKTAHVEIPCLGLNYRSRRTCRNLVSPAIPT
jgi:hypothetical protein